MDMFIDGGWHPSVSGDTQPVTEPATGAIFETVPRGTAADADIAIRSAARAFETWRHVPMAERVRIQRACAQARRG